MNSFFASVEQHERPELRGRPVGVIPVETDRTCVIAASYDAKRLGIGVGTSVREARALCPGIVLVKARPARYVEVHEALKVSVDRCAPIHKVYSIDEWSVRLMGGEQEVGRALALGRRIQAQLREDFSEWLSCSVGIAPTRLLAKIACDLRKPNGLTVLAAEDMPGRLEHLALEELCGIARGMAERLRAHGVCTVRELWDMDRAQAVRAWGSVVGGQWWAGFHGIDEPEPRTRRRSMGHANVLEPRFRNAAGVRQMLTRLLARLGVRLRSEGYVATRLHCQVRYSGESGGRGVERVLPGVQDTPALLEVLYGVLDAWGPHPGVPLQVGVTVSGLEPVSQLLFVPDDPAQRLSEAMDSINARWGSTSVYFGSMHGCCHEMDDKIAFGRIPPRVGK